MTNTQRTIDALREAARAATLTKLASLAGLSKSSVHQLLRDGVANRTLRNLDALERAAVSLSETQLVNDRKKNVNKAGKS